MDKYKSFALFAIFLLVETIVFSSFAYAQSTITSFGGSTSGASASSYQYQPGFQTYYGSERISTYWPILGDAEKCLAREDLMLIVPPAGCQPAVVRSDLLADQNVPVFCQIDAVKINPVIDIDQIKNIRFIGEYPEEVVGTGFHPARAALRTHDTLLGSPLINNIGYVVVVLKQQPIESKLPEFVNVTLNAQIEYTTGNALGVGKAEFILEQVTDQDWEREKLKQSFWNGRYFIRLEEVDSNYATVSIYEGDRRVIAQRVEKGKISQEIFVPGMYCRAGLKINYEGYIAAEKKATIEVSSGNGADVFEVYKGSQFLDGRCSVRDITINNTGDTGKVDLTCRGKSFSLELKKRNLTATTGESKTPDISQVSNREVDNETKKWFKSAIEAYEQIAEDYPAEKEGSYDGARTYGEVALESGIELAKKLGMDETQARLINKYMQLYPNKDIIKKYEDDLDHLYRIDTTASSDVVEFDDKSRTIRLVSLQEPTVKPKAKLFVNNAGLDITEKETKNITDGTVLKGMIKAESVTYNEVKLTSYCYDNSNVLSKSGNSHTLRLDEKNSLFGQKNATICSVPVVLDSVVSKEVAKVRLEPVGGDHTQSETNLTVRIGIEKRAIELTPDKALEKLNDINESIKKWEDISKSLGTVVKGMKAACFGTAALLTFKNFMSGLSGETMARQQVMGGDNGWRNRCKSMTTEGKYASVDACYLANAGEIDKDVATTSNAISEINAKIQEIQSKHETSSGIFGTSVNTDAVRQELATYAKQQYGNVEVDMGRKDWITANGTKLDKVKVSDILTDSNVKNNLVTTDGIRTLMLNAELQKSSGLTSGQMTNVNSNVATVAERVNQNMVNEWEFKRDAERTAKGFAPAFFATPQSQTNRGASVILLNNDIKSKIGNTETGTTHSSTVVVPSYVQTDSLGKEVSGSRFSSGTYILGLNEEDVTKGIYNVQEVWFENKSSGKYDKVDAAKFSGAYGLGNIKAIERISYNNEITSSDRQVKYYETEPYKGMPAIVPFDVKQGWYAATKQTLPVFGGIGAFDASGRVTSFWLCNVGDNKRIEFETGFGDDICQMVNLNTGQPLGSFPGLEEDTARQKVTQATRAIEDAARQYGNKYVTVNGEKFEVGKPAVGQPGTQCQDFMSPKECHLLFNVCDPVICPASRCNFGGTFNVADVIQTGIVGSIFLCLPNIKEGIAIPVCLTGIKAGIDGLISIMRSYRDCLQESVNTGKMVGICDEVYSIYLCEFFWKQVAPFVSVLIPKLVEMAYGQGTRGGAEYLTVMNSWQNAENSVKYFTQSYAVNAMEAFKARNIEEAGTEVCKVFISGKLPTVFESLIEPDSPPQFHAWFDSSTYSSATVPATSQYKVFYHIFAGKDQGVYYSVYLKSPPQSSYYITSPRVPVGSGFIARGESASETRDFTAPEGYKELCVRINNDEECGFKQVSTSFAVNYLRDEYIKEQATQQVSSEEQCISGTPSAASLLNPNVQAGVQETISPSLYERGVVRICASNNPGSNTDPTRWTDVGYCNDAKIRCWLDKKSIENAITDGNVGAVNETLSALQQNLNETLEEEGYFIEGNAAAELNSLREAVKALQTSSNFVEDANQIITRINTVFDKFWYNGHKAQLLMLKGQTSEIVARKLFEKAVPDKPVNTADPTVAGNTGTGTILEMPGSIIFEFKDGTAANNLYYSFKDSWKWSPDKIKWYSVNYLETPDEKNKQFITSLQGKSYEQGLVLLVDRTKKNAEGGIFGDAQLVTNKVTVDKNGLINVKQTDEVVYLRYTTDWIWSLDNQFWMTSAKTIADIGIYTGENPSIENIKLISAINGKQYAEGLGIIFKTNTGEVPVSTTTPGGATPTNFDNKYHLEGDRIKLGSKDLGMFLKSNFIYVDGNSNPVASLVGGSRIQSGNLEELPPETARYILRLEGHTISELGTGIAPEWKIISKAFYQRSSGADRVISNSIEAGNELILKILHTCDNIEVKSYKNDVLIETKTIANVNYYNDEIDVGRSEQIDDKYKVILQCKKSGESIGNEESLGDVKVVAATAEPVYED
jgi:hypothetical protein